MRGCATPMPCHAKAGDTGTCWHEEVLDPGAVHHFDLRCDTALASTEHETRNQNISLVAFLGPQQINLSILVGIYVPRRVTYSTTKSSMN